MRSVPWCGSVCLLFLVLSNQPILAEPITSFAVIGDAGVRLGQSSRVGNGLVGSNGDVQVNTFGQVRGIRAGGNVNVLAPANVAADVLAGGNFNLGAFSTVQANAGANGTVTFGNSLTRVNGNLRYGIPPPPPASQVGGTITQGIEPVSPVTVPPPDTFIGGGSDVTLAMFESRTLAPGHHGILTLGGTNQLFLSSGDYFFDRIDSPSGFGVNLRLDLTGGGLNLFVVGDATLGTFSTAIVNGQPFDSADPALAAGVFLETLGRFNLAASSQFFGTVFAPNDSITLDSFARITGSLISGGRIDSATDISRLEVNFVPSGRFQDAVPEPTSALLLSVGALGLLGYAWRRRNTPYAT